MNDFINQYYKALSKDIEARKSVEFDKHLSEAGFSFASEEDKANFFSEHLTLVSSVETPDFKTLWFNYGKPDEKIISTFWDRYDFDYKFDGEKYTINVIWGNPPPTPSPKPAQ